MSWAPGYSAIRQQANEMTLMSADRSRADECGRHSGRSVDCRLRHRRLPVVAYMWASAAGMDPEGLRELTQRVVAGVFLLWLGFVSRRVLQDDV